MLQYHRRLAARPAAASIIAIPIIAIAILMAVSAAAILGVGGAPPAGAQGGVTVTDSGHENQFPDGLRFYIDADGANAVEEIRVYVRKLGQSTRTAYRTVEFELAPDGSISGEAQFKSKTGSEYIPTGTRLAYHFEIRTADGGVTETAPQTVVYLNAGLDWQLLSDGFINVYYYPLNRRSQPRAEGVLAVAADTYDFMRPILGGELTEPMNIVVYSNYDDMLEAIRQSSLTTARELRTLGKAFTNERALLVDGELSDNTVLSTAAHEFTHLLVADAAGSAYSGVHTWLNEGLAVYSERQSYNEFETRIGDAINKNNVPRLSGLVRFSGDSDKILQNYGQGHAVVTYMIETHGPEKMAALFASLPTTRDTAKSLEFAYGLTMLELDNEWRDSVGLAPWPPLTESKPPIRTPSIGKPKPTPMPTPTVAPTPAITAASSMQSGAPTATPAPTAIPTPTPTPAPTYTPRAMAAASATATPAPTTPAVTAPASGSCSAPAPQSQSGGDNIFAGELAAAGLLAIPAGLIGLAAIRRRRE